MLNREKTGLEIFENFWPDYELKKHKKDESSMPIQTVDGGTGGNLFWDVGMAPVPTALSGAGSAAQQTVEYQAGMLLKRIFNFLFGWLIPKPKPKISVQQFFNAVKGALQKPELYTERVDSYLKIALAAKQNGQTALFEQLSKQARLVKRESTLLANDLCICITEEQVVKFYKESDKGLSLTYIRNFINIIPADVLKKKAEADDLLVFDNYVILHYDPKQKAFKLTQEEVRKKKDPILFGIIGGHRKLYYIADWVDEYCDLTLQQFIDKFGAEAINANNITVKYSPTK